MGIYAILRHEPLSTTVRWSKAGILILLAVLPCLIVAAQQTSASATNNLQAAEALLQQGRLDDARAAVQAELRRKPSSVEAYNLLAIIESEQQDFTSAIASLQKALQLAPNSVKTYNNLGNVFIAEKRPDLAEKAFRNGLRLDQQNRDGNYNLGTLLLARGHPAEAILYFERVRPPDRETRFELVRAYLETKRTAEALRMATALSSENQGDVRLHFSLGVLLASRGQNKAALLELEKADVLAPNTFQILFNLGQACLLDGQYSRAELQLNRALKVKPDSVETLYLLAQSRWKQSQPLDALDFLVRARRLAPDNTDIILLMAQIGIAQGYFADAIPLLQKGLEIAPQRTDLRSALGESYFKADQIEKAIDEFQKVVADQPSMRAYAFLGLSHIYLGQFDAAKQDFHNGLRLDPHSSFCLFNLGYIAVRQGDTASATETFLKVLQSDPDFPDALLELANIRIEANQYPQAEELLKRYIRVSRNPGSGYYKLAVVERKLHNSAEADRYLARFQELSRNPAPTSYLYEDLFNYLDQRDQLSAPAREQQDLAALLEQAKKHPDQPEILYMLAQAYLQAGSLDEARNTVAQLDHARADDARTLVGAGALFARYHLYDDAIPQFQAALQADPASDDAKVDLATALFRKAQYAQALDAAQQVSAQERSDDAWLALVADIYAHLGDTSRAAQMFRNAVEHSPDNDQNYLSLAMLQFRQNDAAAAKRTLLQGQARMPASGKILWGLGVSAVMEGSTAAAARLFGRALDLLPEWSASYSMLGVFYYQTGQTAKAKEMLDRFKNSSVGGLDVNKIEQTLAAAPQVTAAPDDPLPLAKRQQLLQIAQVLVDGTL
jgi:tetratricopeptide (TPR) repeat protein